MYQILKFLLQNCPTSRALFVLTLANNHRAQHREEQPWRDRESREAFQNLKDGQFLVDDLFVEAIPGRVSQQFDCLVVISNLRKLEYILNLDQIHLGKSFPNTTETPWNRIDNPLVAGCVSSTYEAETSPTGIDLSTGRDTGKLDVISKYESLVNLRLLITRFIVSAGLKNSTMRQSPVWYVFHILPQLHLKMHILKPLFTALSECFRFGNNNLL